MGGVCYSAQFLFRAFIQSSFKQTLAEKVGGVGGVFLWNSLFQLFSSMSLSSLSRVHPEEARSRQAGARALLLAVPRGEAGCGGGVVELSSCSVRFHSIRYSSVSMGSQSRFHRRESHPEADTLQTVPRC